MINEMTKPVKNIPVRDLVFGDLPLEHWAGIDSHEQPWINFKKAKEADDDGEDQDAIDVLQQIMDMPGLESRHYLQAAHFLQQLYSVKALNPQLMGVVVEVAIEGGVDLLAVYADHSARYYNYTGSAIILETATDEIRNKIDNILLLGDDLVKQIGAWKYTRPGAPIPGFARINFLTTGGLHFGEAAQAVLFKDPTAGKIMYAMLDMMETLMNLKKN